MVTCTMKFQIKFEIVYKLDTTDNANNMVFSNFTL